MKNFSATLLAIALTPIAFAASPQQASFTLKTDKVIFQNSKDRLEYKSNKVPGLFMVNFEMKTIINNGKEINVSELTLENQSDGSKLTLLNQHLLKLFGIHKVFLGNPPIQNEHRTRRCS